MILSFAACCRNCSWFVAVISETEGKNWLEGVDHTQSRVSVTDKLVNLLEHVGDDIASLVRSAVVVGPDAILENLERTVISKGNPNSIEMIPSIVNELK